MQQEGQGQQRVLHAAAVCMCVSHCPVGPLLSVQGLLWFIAVSHVRAVCFRGGLVGVERMTRGRGVVWGSARTCVCVCLSIMRTHSAQRVGSCVCAHTCPRACLLSLSLCVCIGCGSLTAAGPASCRVIAGTVAGGCEQRRAGGCRGG